MFIMLQGLMLIVVVGLPSLGESTIGPTYRSHQRVCDRDTECDLARGEVCWRVYRGCYHGVCMCNPESHTLDDRTGECRPFKLGLNACTERDVCLNSMICLNGTCQCPQGEMSAEGNFCLRANHRLLGETCVPKRDICLQVSVTGYTTSEVQCSHNKICQCQKGYRSEGRACRKPAAGAKCTVSYECEGGFVCLNGRCRCPNNYIAVASNSKCANANALIDLPLGSACDEIGEARYCAAGLICQKCDNEQEPKCVQYSLSPPEAEYFAGSSSVSPSNTILSIILCLFCTYFVLHETR